MFGEGRFSVPVDGGGLSSEKRRPICVHQRRKGWRRLLLWSKGGLGVRWQGRVSFLVPWQACVFGAKGYHFQVPREEDVRGNHVLQGQPLTLIRKGVVSGVVEGLKLCGVCLQVDGRQVNLEAGPCASVGEGSAIGNGAFWALTKPEHG